MPVAAYQRRRRFRTTDQKTVPRKEYSVADVPRYRFGPLERRGMLLGLRGTQLMVLGTAVGLAVIALSAAPNGTGIGIAAISSSLAAFIAFVPFSGRTIEEWTPIVGRWLGKGLTGERRFVSSLPSLGRSGVAEPRPAWPPQLKGLELLAAAAPG